MLAAPPALPAPGAAAAGSGAPPAEEIKGHTVNSPMVGTFYRAPSPARSVRRDRPVGRSRRRVVHHRGDEILNQIESDRAGMVKRILVENGERWSTTSRCSSSTSLESLARRATAVRGE